MREQAALLHNRKEMPGKLTARNCAGAGEELRLTQRQAEQPCCHASWLRMNLTVAWVTVHGYMLGDSSLNQVQPCTSYLPQCSVISLSLLPVPWPFLASQEEDRAPRWWLSLYCFPSQGIHSEKREGLFSAPC